MSVHIFPSSASGSWPGQRALVQLKEPTGPLPSHHPPTWPAASGSGLALLPSTWFSSHQSRHCCSVLTIPAHPCAPPSWCRAGPSSSSAQGARAPWGCGHGCSESRGRRESEGRGHQPSGQAPNPHPAPSERRAFPHPDPAHPRGHLSSAPQCPRL